MSNLISRQDAIRDIRSMDVCVIYDDMCSTEEAVEKAIVATKRNAIFGLERMPSAQPEQSIAEWQKDFREYINMLNIPRDDYNGIMEYINDFPSAESEHLVKESGDLVKDLVNDCINRQDAVKTMYDACEYIDDESLHIDVIVDALENLPSASPDLSTYSDNLWKIAYERGKTEGRKKGKWIRTRTMTHDGELYCSECEQEHPEQKIIWNFCPNCGSYNGGEEE